MLLQPLRSSVTGPESELRPVDPAEPLQSLVDGEGDGASRGGPITRRLRGPRRRRAVASGMIAVVLVAALVVYVFVLRPRASAQEEAAPLTTTAQASMTTFEQAVTTAGTLTPSMQEDMAFAASGKVLSVDVAEGDTVEAGQTLAAIDTLQLDAALAQAKADLAQAQADLADARESNDGSDAAEAAVEARDAAVAVAQQTYDDAEAAMSDATLTAPASGLVTSVGVAVGDTVGSSSDTDSSGSASSDNQGGVGTIPDMSSGGSTSGATSSSSAAAAFTIVSTDAWKVELSVGESDVVTIATGDQAEMTSDGLAGTVFGTVSEIGRLPSTTQGAVAYPVTITVTGSSEGLYDGVDVDVSIVTERRTDVLAVPAAAISTDDSGHSVVSVIADDGSVSEHVVETGDSSGSMVEVVSGLAEGETVSYTVFTPRAGQSEDGERPQGGFPEGGFPEDFDPSQLPGGGFPEGFDPSQLPGGGFPGQGGTS